MHIRALADIDDPERGLCHIEPRPRGNGFDGLLKLPARKHVDPQRDERETFTGVCALAGAVLLFAMVGLAILSGTDLFTAGQRLLTNAAQAVGL